MKMNLPINILKGYLQEERQNAEFPNSGNYQLSEAIRYITLHVANSRVLA